MTYCTSRKLRIRMIYHQELSHTSHPGDCSCPHMLSGQHTALNLTYTDEKSPWAKSSGWSTKNFTMSSGWFRVDSYVNRMIFYLALSDHDVLLRWQWFQWLMHMILELAGIRPLWGGFTRFYSLCCLPCRYTEQAIELTIEAPVISDAMSL